ncbi:protease inhibitor I42 family protein [Hyphomicrobium sp. CS1GBMeth3]|uniref:protease inhibitor I42 family protein n=1 Tax=Hyphomicrobium sp. CS1GBMeth3 TaxID=1892845 RepID=UPI000ACDCDD2|nr:protease inhibitor I42 family protein [Hyphomicrobium sp. CS1GBMeth3]
MLESSLRRDAWRGLVVCLISIVGAANAALAQGTPVQISVGETATLQLDGNPSTGYTWVMQDGAQQYFSIITVQALGYAKPAVKPGERPLLGASQKYQVLVTGLAAGQANLVFDYVKSGDPKPARTSEFAIEVLDDQTGGRNPSETERQDLFPNPADEVDAGGDPDPY